MERFFSILGKTVLVLFIPALLLTAGYYIGTHKQLVPQATESLKTTFSEDVEAKATNTPTPTTRPSIIQTSPSITLKEKVATPDAKLSPF